MKKICFATNNKNKLAEIRAALQGVCEIVGLADIGCNEELPETTDTLEGNSLQKAKHVATNYQIDCFADDTGLEVTALNGEPGVYSARYAGLECDADKNIDKLLYELGDTENRDAQFKTIITLIEGDEIQQFEGLAKGTITTKRIGVDGFGYDPIFIPQGHSVTFAEMTMAQKNEISHRGLAVKKLITYLKE